MSGARVLFLSQGRALAWDAELLQALNQAGFEAEAGLLPRQGLVDAVVLEMEGREDGWDLLKEIRADSWTRSTPVILLFGPEDASLGARGLRAGADDFLTRPFDPEELVARLEMRMAEQTEDRTRFEGRLEAHSVAELVQTLEAGSKSGELRITHDGLSGSLLLRDGKVVTAEWAGHSGVSAVRTMLELTTGRFRFQPGEIVGGTWDGLDLAPLLMDEAWVTDEIQARKRFLPPPEALLEVSGSLPKMSEDVAQLPVTEVFEYLANSSGVAWSALHLRCLDSPLRVRLAVAWLAEQGAIRASAPDRESVPQPTLDVVIVDASASGRHHLTDLVSRGGWSPIVFKDGPEAMEKIWHASRGVGLIVLDADLPGMDGYKLTAKLRATASLAEVPIVMLTATVGGKYRQKAVAAGVTEYLVKPYRDEALLQLIRRLTVS